uniref:Putative ovule protein n=1 Tax=Solanum chacoense TaxID=4108 RepID=A0A0V0GUM9_SOLCH
MGEGSKKQIPQQSPKFKATTRRLQGWLERNCQSATMKRDSGYVQSYMSNICFLSIFLIEGMMKTKPSPATGKYQRYMVSMMESE